MDDYRLYKPEQLAADKSFRNWKLYGKEEDTLFWEQWLLLNPDKQLDVEKAERLLELVFSNYDQIEKEDVKAEMQRIAAKLTEDKSSGSSRPLWKTATRIAAAIIVLIAGWRYFYQPRHDGNIQESLQNIPDQQVSLIEQSNLSNRKKLVSLPDGSTVLMMRNSRIFYPETFSGDTREVRFSGEAFFEIVKNPDKPFFVYTDKIVTKVLGTSFTVRSYDGEAPSVTVKTGSVSVFRSGKNPGDAAGEREAIVLSPNERIVFSDRGEPFVQPLLKNPINVPLSAHNSNLEFTGTPIRDVFAILEKIYDTPINFDTTKMKNCYLTASLQDEPFFRKLDLICRTLDAQYQIGPEGDITVLSNGCE